LDGLREGCGGHGVGGAWNGGGSQPASYVGDVFREIHKALKEAADAMPPKESKAGF